MRRMTNASDTSLPNGDTSTVRRLFEKAWIIINPAVRQGHGADAIRQVAIEQQRAGADWRVRVSMRPGQAEALAAEAVDAGAKLVLAVGGHGTAHEVVNGLMRFDAERRTVFSVVPVGSGNDLAKILGVPEGIQPALAALRAGRLASIDLGRVGPRWFVNDIGLGLLADANRLYHSMPRLLLGPVRYMAAALGSALRNRACHLRLSSDAEARFDGPFSICSVSNGAWTGGRFYMNPRAVVDDGLLEVCVAEPVGRWEALTTLPKLRRGLHLGSPHVTSFQTASLRLESDDLEIYQVDGELNEFPRDGLEIRIARRALRVLCLSKT